MEDPNRPVETGAGAEGFDPLADAPRPAPEDPHAVRPFTRQSVLLLALFALGAPALIYGFLMIQYLLVWRVP